MNSCLKLCDLITAKPIVFLNTRTFPFELRQQIPTINITIQHDYDKSKIIGSAEYYGHRIRLENQG